MCRLAQCLLWLVGVVFLQPLPTAGQNPGKAGKTTIHVTTRTWSPMGGYKVLPGVKVLVGQGGAKVGPPLGGKGKSSGWVSDDKGKVAIEVPDGEPVTLVFHMSHEYVPVVQKLAAAGATYEVGPALITVDDYRNYEIAHPNEPRAHEVFSQASRAIPGNDETEEEKQVRKELATGKERTRPRSSIHPSISKPPAPAKLTLQEQQAVRKCLDLIRTCYLKDGSIRMAGSGDPVWVEPYHGTQAVLALLAARNSANLPAARKKADLDIVRGWLIWYAEHMDATGIPPAYEGTMATKVEKVMDEKRQYVYDMNVCAGTYLLAVARYHQLTTSTPPKVIEAAVRSFRTLEALTQRDGLTIARPANPVKFLAENVMVYAGLVEGGKFFETIKLRDEADEAYLAADLLAVGMRRFWQDDHYAFAVHQNRNPEGKLETPKEAAANLLGLSHLLPSRPLVWATLRKQFKPDGGRLPTMPVERWLIAAGRVAPNDIGILRKQATAEALTFTGDLYVTRPAVMILALIDGPARFPDVLPPLTKQDAEIEK